VQLVLHEESLFGPSDLRNFITWAVSLVVIQSLAVRKGFLHRFALFALFVGFCTVPFLNFSEEERVGLEGVAMSSANAIGMWFGYCFIYFLIAGLEAKNNIVRAASWAGGCFSLVMMGLSVSRGPLLGSAMAGAWAFKRVLKRSFLPIVGLLFICFIVYVTGIADSLIGKYLERGTVDTGRSYLWEVGFKRFLDSWWEGVGFSNYKVVRPLNVNPQGPHNGLLLIGLSSGVVPLAFFIGYLWYAARAALQSRKVKSVYAPFLFPLFLFGMLEAMILDWAFMSPWFMVVVSTIFTVQDYPHLGQKAGRKTPRKGEVYGSPLSSPAKAARPQAPSF
jgi:hypothetical protein